MEQDNYIYKHQEKEFKGKQSTTLLLNHIPVESDGKPGDFALHNTPDGSNLYVKYGTNWWFITRLAKAVGKSGKFDGRLPEGEFSKVITKEALRMPQYVSSTPRVGDIYINDSENEVRFYGSSGWQVLTGSSTTGKIITYTSEDSEKPLIIIQNTNTDANGAEIRFIKDKGANGANNDIAGKITFYGDDTAQDNVEWSRIEGYAAMATNGAERGGLKLLVKPNADATLESGLTMVGTPTSDEVDVTIGNGAASVTTTAGDLSITSHLTAVKDIASTGDTITFNSTSSFKPDVQIINTHTNNRSAVLKFIKDPVTGGGSASNDDPTGDIRSYGYNNADQQTQYAAINFGIIDVTDGSEAGKLLCNVITDGNQRTGLQLTGSSTDIVNVDIGYGDTSTVTTKGSLSLTTHLTFKEASAPTGSSGYGYLHVNTGNDLIYIDESDNASPPLQVSNVFFLTSGYYAATNGARYIPLVGGSTVETSTVTGPDYINDDAWFICPKDLKITKIYLNITRQNSGQSEPGDTTVRLYKNTSAYSGTVTHDVPAGYDYTNNLQVTAFDFTSSNTYSAGDVLTIRVDPTNTVYYVNVTVVGEYT